MTALGGSPILKTRSPALMTGLRSSRSRPPPVYCRVASQQLSSQAVPVNEGSGRRVIPDSGFDPFNCTSEVRVFIPRLVRKRAGMASPLPFALDRKRQEPKSSSRCCWEAYGAVTNMVCFRCPLPVPICVGGQCDSTRRASGRFLLQSAGQSHSRWRGNGRASSRKRPHG